MALLKPLTGLKSTPTDIALSNRLKVGQPTFTPAPASMLKPKTIASANVNPGAPKGPVAPADSAPTSMIDTAQAMENNLGGYGNLDEMLAGLNANYQVSVNPSPTVKTSSLSDVNTYQDIQNALKENAKIREQYLASLQPSQTELDLGNQLNALRDQIASTELSAQAGMNKIEDQVIPMEFIVGEQAGLQRQSALQMNALTAREESLSRRLGLEQERRKTLTAGLAGASEMAMQDATFALNMQKAIDDQEKNYLTAIQGMTTEGRNQLALVLDKLQGVDPEAMDLNTQMQLQQIATQAGIPFSLVVDGLRVLKNQTDAELLKTTSQNKALSDTAISNITQFQSALQNLGTLRKKIEDNPSAVGPIAGLWALNPWSSSRQLQAEVDRVRQIVGKALEGGVLRKEDEEKYKKILATLTDTPTTALYKIDSLIQQMEAGLDSYIQLQKQAGRDTSQVGTSAEDSW